MKDFSKGAGTVTLSNATLDQLPDNIQRPGYDRATLTPGIVHIGLGNFHRAHQAWYLHRLMQMGQAHDWAIIGAGMRPYDKMMRQKLLAQDCLSSLFSLDPSGRSAEVIGSMIDYLPVEEGCGPLIACMADPGIKIVSLTVTEGGYYVDPVRGGLDETHADIQHDMANPNQPRTAFGAIIAALKQRRTAGHGPFTVQSCDNLQGNGRITRQVICALARGSDPDLAEWISQHASFPNSMVDCIVPATGPDELALAQQFGVADQVPVTHEPYRQWVIEDDFCAGRPEWEQVGATLTGDVHDFEAMKIRLLNAGHQVLANAGELLSVTSISGCMTHPQISGLFSKVAHEEIAPHVASVPDTTPQAYIDLISERFSNPAILDTTRRVAFDGVSRHGGFILPTLRDALAAGGQVRGLALVEALWARMCAGTREDGSVIVPNDPIWDRLQNTALDAKASPRIWLGMQDIYGDLADRASFAEPFDAWLNMLWNEGVLATLDCYLSESPVLG